MNVAAISNTLYNSGFVESTLLSVRKKSRWTIRTPNTVI